MSTASEKPSIAVIKAIVDDLAAVGIDPLHLRAEALRVGDTRPSLGLHLHTRTDFETLIAHWGIKKPVERRGLGGNQRREWYAEHDTSQHRMLIQVVSWPWHDDWQPYAAERADGAS